MYSFKKFSLKTKANILQQKRKILVRFGCSRVTCTTGIDTSILNCISYPDIFANTRSFNSVTLKIKLKKLLFSNVKICMYK